jgi:very-short-patch-repair endonuclease
MTDAELIMCSRLRRCPSRAIKFRRQHPIGIYIADFAVVSSRLVIEVDGATHSSDAERTYDEARELYLRRRGWRVLRVQNGDIYKRLDDILEFIASQLPLRPAHARHLPRKRGGKTLSGVLAFVRRQSIVLGVRGIGPV